MSVNSRLKAIQIIGQRKAFYRQKIPEPSCTRKETIDTDILVTFRNDDNNHTIYQSNEQTFLKKKEKEPAQTVLKSIYQSNTYKKDLSWPNFDNEPKGSREAASEELTVLHICFCSLSNNSKQQLGVPDQMWTRYSIHGRMVDLQRYRATS